MRPKIYRIPGQIIIWPCLCIFFVYAVLRNPSLAGYVLCSVIVLVSYRAGTSCVKLTEDKIIVKNAWWTFTYDRAQVLKFVIEPGTMVARVQLRDGSKRIVTALSMQINPGRKGQYYKRAIEEINQELGVQ